ncbi:MAG: ABC transporter ATP-binding protein [Lachnospiraceae bacterium]|nr:ABC transporter ATP-binding protein [Lachnospiraceae bacterium]
MILEFKGVTGQNKGFNLQDITFSLEEGFVMGVIGRNGAGKTTLLRYIYDEDIKYTGEILFRGSNIQSLGKAVFNEIGVVSDDFSCFPGLSAMENAKLLSVFYSDWSQDRFTEMMREMQVPPSTPLANVSRGEWLKYQVCLAYAHNTRLYLMDEVTSGMDPVFRRDFFKFLHNLMLDESVGIIITDHNKEEVDIHMDYCLTIDKGRVESMAETLPE